MLTSSRLMLVGLALAMAACSTPSVRTGNPAPSPVAAETEPTASPDPSQRRPVAPSASPAPAATAPSATPRLDAPGPTSRRGGYYMDDGPGENPPSDLNSIPNAQPRAERLMARANRPYVVFGRSYQPMTALQPYRQRGHASWYGRKFHGQKTAIGEVYDMYGMTAAHPTLPLPSFVRVTNLSNGEQVIVRVNDRGPFLQGRIIDLSYTAAAKLGYIRSGSAEVEVELLLNPDAEPTDLLAKGTGVTRPGSSAGPSLASGNGSVLALAPIAASAPISMSVPTAVAMSASVPALTATPTSAATPAATPAATRREVADERLLVETTVVTEPAQAAPTTASATSARDRAGPATLAEPRLSVSIAQGPMPMTDKPPQAATVPVAKVPAPQAYLQLGAFSSRENAEAIRGRLAAELEWLQKPISIVSDDGRLFKLVTGPFGSRTDSGTVAQRIQRATGSLPFATMR